ncbi:MAG: hypothetical protein NTY48_07135, partial [Candidatus Diapherotrites archaeon]|nr:hypothetical protein [Candidatus Diapherotrites archaeon]
MNKKYFSVLAVLLVLLLVIPSAFSKTTTMGDIIVDQDRLISEINAMGPPFENQVDAYETAAIDIRTVTYAANAGLLDFSKASKQFDSLNQMEGEIRAVWVDAGKKRADLTRLQADVELLAAEYPKKLTRLETQMANLQEAVSKAGNVTAYHAQLEAAENEVSQWIVEKRSKIAQIDARMSALAQSEAQINSEIAAAQSSSVVDEVLNISNVPGSASAPPAGEDARITAIKDERTVLTEERAILAKHVENYTTNVAELKAERTASIPTKENLLAQVETLKKDVTNLQGAMKVNGNIIDAASIQKRKIVVDAGKDSFNVIWNRAAAKAQNGWAKVREANSRTWAFFKNLPTYAKELSGAEVRQLQLTVDNAKGTIADLQESARDVAEQKQVGVDFALTRNEQITDELLNYKRIFDDASDAARGVNLQGLQTELARRQTVLSEMKAKQASSLASIDESVSTAASNFASLEAEVKQLESRISAITESQRRQLILDETQVQVTQKRTQLEQWKNEQIKFTQSTQDRIKARQAEINNKSLIQQDLAAKESEIRSVQAEITAKKAAREASISASKLTGGSGDSTFVRQ